MKIFVSAFKNIYKTTPALGEFSNWDKFVASLQESSKIPATKGGHNSAPLISCAKFKDGTTRANKNVEFWSWAALDVDDYEFTFTKHLPIDVLNELMTWLESVIPFEFVCYSTASSTVEHPKFRLVFPISRRVYDDELQHFWFSLNKKVGLGDQQTKDMSRMFYIPGQYPDAFNFFCKSSHNKVSLNVDDLLQEYPFVKPKTGFLENLPDDLREEILHHRKKQMTNAGVSWSGYRDCPFFPQKLAKEYRGIFGTGWYHKMYQIMIAVAGNAIREGYPITPQEISVLCRELDRETGNWYKNRPLEREASGAIEWVYRNN